MTILTSRNDPRTTSLTLAAMAMVLAAPLTGCEKKKPPPPPPPAPVIVPPPPKIEVQALLQELESDARVQFPETAAPTDRALAEGAIRLADAIARGDSGKLRALLDRSGQAILDDLVSRDEWQAATSKIEAVRIAQLTSAGPASIVTTAIQEPGGAYILNWTAMPAGESVTFVPLPAAAGTKPRSSDWDTANVMFAAADMPDMHDLEALRDGLPIPEDSGESSPRNPNRKNTPAGPVTIPGGPGGG